LASTDKCKGTSGHKIGFFGWTKFLEKIETTGAMDSGEGFLLQKAQGLAPLHTHFNNLFPANWIFDSDSTFY